MKLGIRKKRKKMSQVIDLCEDSSDDNGEWPNTPSVPPLPLSRKRPHDKEESSNAAHPRSENGPVYFVPMATMKYSAPAVYRYRSVMPNVTTAKSGTTAIATNTADTEDQEENDGGQEEVLVGDDASDMECIPDTSDGSNDAEEKEDTRQALANESKSENEVEVVLPHKRRRDGVMKSEHSGNNDAAGNCEQILKGDHATEKDDGSADHRESHEDIAADVSPPINLDSEQTSRDYGSVNKHSQKNKNTLKPPPNAAERQWERQWVDSVCKVCLRELADYRKIHGHCSVPRRAGENSRLANCVATQRVNYKLHLEGTKSQMTTFRIQGLESLGFEWKAFINAWEDRFSEHAAYSKIHGNCVVPESYSGDTKLAQWVSRQRSQYKLQLEGEKLSMTLSRIQKLDSLGFNWNIDVATWEDRLNENPRAL